LPASIGISETDLRASLLPRIDALTQERRKYGLLGFNQSCDWTTGDVEISQKQLKMFFDVYDQVLCKVLRYLTGEMNYEGHVTDDWDRLTVLSILDDFSTEKVTSDSYEFTENPRYLSMPGQSLNMYLASLGDFPINDSPGRISVGLSLAILEPSRG
jgi:dynein heavy chain